jgi:hypothetical protein
MTKIDYLNTASDLRRIAYWVATNQNKDLVIRLCQEAKRKVDIKEYLNIDFSQTDRYLAEDLLMASQTLQKLIL